MSIKLIVKNKKAYFDYDIQETFEVGIVLTGDEVKSLRAGQASLIGSFAHIQNGELYLINCHITPYIKAFQKNEDASRRRKLLIHKRQIMKLIGEIAQKGITIIPLTLYFNEKNRVKVQLGIARHKKAASKKATIKERDIKRETSREMKGYSKG